MLNRLYLCLRPTKSARLIWPLVATLRVRHGISPWRPNFSGKSAPHFKTCAASSMAPSTSEPLEASDRISMRSQPRRGLDDRGLRCPELSLLGDTTCALARKASTPLICHRTAGLSRCRRYRYWLRRHWDPLLHTHSSDSTHRPPMLAVTTRRYGVALTSPKTGVTARY